MLCEQIINWIVSNRGVYCAQWQSLLPSAELKNKLMHCTQRLFLFLHNKVHLCISIPHFGSFIPTLRIPAKLNKENNRCQIVVGFYPDGQLAKLLVGTRGNKGKCSLKKGEYDWLGDYAEHAQMASRQAESAILIFFKAICDLISLGRDIHLDMQVAVLKITNRVCEVRARIIQQPLGKENRQFVNPSRVPSQKDRWDTSLGASFSKQPNLAQIKHHLDEGLRLLSNKIHHDLQ